MATTYHLALLDEWLASEGSETYAPGAFEVEGFIHCTDGEAELVATANRYFSQDPRTFVVLEIDLDRVDVFVHYEDPDRIYPHIYGRLPRNAVVAVHPVLRDAEGRFVGFGEENAS
jgi:uncharacterized protein (DUF952 family)